MGTIDRVRYPTIVRIGCYRQTEPGIVDNQCRPVGCYRQTVGCYRQTVGCYRQTERGDTHHLQIVEQGEANESQHLVQRRRAAPSPAASLRKLGHLKGTAVLRGVSCGRSEWLLQQPVSPRRLLNDSLSARRQSQIPVGPQRRDPNKAGDGRAVCRHLTAGGD